MKKVKDALTIATLTVGLMVAAGSAIAWAFGVVEDYNTIRKSVMTLSEDVGAIRKFLKEKFDNFP